MFVKIIKTSPAPLQTLIERYGLMQSIDDVVVNIGGLPRFESHYLPVLERFADRVQELPLQKAAFSDIGGSLTAAVKAATLAVRTCDATIFSPTATAAERLTNDAHYRWLAYCSVLATVYLITAASIDPVSDGPKGTETYCWADDKNLIEWMPSYQMAWVDRPQFLLSRLVAYLPALLFPGMFSHLPRQLVSDLGASINPALTSSSTEPPLARVVRQSIEKVISDEKAGMSGWVSEAPAETSNPSPSTSVTQGTPNPATPMVVEPGTGEILSGWPVSGEQASAKGHQEPSAPPPPPTPKETTIQIKAREWLTAVANNPDLENQVTLLSNGCLEVSRKAMNFGATPSNTYKLLHEASYAVEKTDKSAILNKKGAAIFQAAKAAGKAT